MATIVAALDHARRTDGRAVVLFGYHGAGKSRALNIARRRCRGRAGVVDDLGFACARGKPGATPDLVPGTAPALVPELVLIDDAHLLDSRAQRDVGAMMGGSGGRATCVVLTSLPLRRVDPDPWMARLCADPRTTSVTLAPLVGAEVEALTARTLGEAAAEPLVRALTARTAGAPWLVEALAAEVARQPPEARAVAAETLVPPAVLDWVRRWLLDIGRRCLRVAEAVAVYEPGELDVIGTLAELDARAAEQEIDCLVDGGLLAVELPARYRQPLIRAAVTELMPPGRRSRLNAVAADLARARGGEARRVAAHLLLAPPVGAQRAVDTLATAAAEAALAGNSEETRRLLSRALAEPPRADHARKLSLALARAEVDCGAPDVAARRIRSLISDLDHCDTGEAVLLLATAHERTGEAPAAARLLVEHADRVAATDPALATRLETRLALLAPASPETYTLVARRHAEGRVAADAPEPYLSQYRLTIAETQAMAGAMSAADAAALATQALGSPEQARRLRSANELARSMWLLLRADAFEVARRHLEHRLGNEGREPDRALLLALLGLVELRGGTLTAAQASLDAAVATAREVRHDLALTAALAFRLELDLELGDCAATARDLEAVAPLLVEPTPLWATVALIARGRLRHERGDPEGAVEDILRAGRAKGRTGTPNPAGFHWASAACAPLVALGRTTEAKRLAAEELRQARAWGAPLTLARAFRGLARALPVADRAAPLAEGLRVLQDSAANLEAAHTALELGDTLAQAGRTVAAREPYRVALDRAGRAEAERLLRKAEIRLRSVDARPRRVFLTGPESLTPAERRVAELAATGAANPEIAARMQLSRRTVENHLARTYAKLKCARSELGSALVDSTTTGV